jgi:hypothetical protein
MIMLLLAGAGVYLLATGTTTGRNAMRKTGLSGVRRRKRRRSRR